MSAQLGVPVALVARSVVVGARGEPGGTPRCRRCGSPGARGPPGGRRSPERRAAPAMVSPKRPRGSSRRRERRHEPRAGADRCRGGPAGAAAGGCGRVQRDERPMLEPSLAGGGDAQGPGGAGRAQGWAAEQAGPETEQVGRPRGQRGKAAVQPCSRATRARSRRLASAACRARRHALPVRSRTVASVLSPPVGVGAAAGVADRLALAGVPEVVVPAPPAGPALPPRPAEPALPVGPEPPIAPGVSGTAVGFGVEL